MNIKMLKAAVAGLVLSVSGIANAGLIDFSDYSDGTITSIDDVTFSLEGGVDSSGSPYKIRDGLSNSSTGFYPTSQFLTFTFDNLVSDISFIFDNEGDNNLSFFYAYSLDDVLLDSFDISDFVDSYSSTATGVSYIKFSNGSPSSSWIFQVDEISYNASEVPEPTTLAIFALGIMGLASRRFKKQ